MIAALEQVTVRFGALVALDGVSLRAEAGTVTCVVGGDGAGKSTLLRVLCGAVGPDEGAVQRPDRGAIGFLSSGSGVYSDLSVEENLAFSAAVYGLSPAETRRRAARLLEMTGLDAAAHRLGSELSGGMRQKLGVVRAMLHGPRLLVLDEPTAGVDPVSRADLWRLIAEAAAAGTAVVLSTTYVDEAERASAVLLLEGGRALVSGTPEGIVAAVPGTVTSSDARVAEDETRSWRRGHAWLTWHPGEVPDGAPDLAAYDLVAPDLAIAVVVASLRDELVAGGSGGGPQR